jgi:hypothetical protein
MSRDPLIDARAVKELGLTPHEVSVTRQKDLIARLTRSPARSHAVAPQPQPRSTEWIADLATEDSMSKEEYLELQSALAATHHVAKPAGCRYRPPVINLVEIATAESGIETLNNLVDATVKHARKVAHLIRARVNLSQDESAMMWFDNSERSVGIKGVIESDLAVIERIREWATELKCGLNQMITKRQAATDQLKANGASSETCDTFNVKTLRYRMIYEELVTFLELTVNAGIQ